MTDGYEYHLCLQKESQGNWSNDHIHCRGSQLLFGRVRINSEVIKHLADVVWCNWKWCVPAKLTWDMISSSRYFTISGETSSHSFDRGGNVGKYLERDLVIRMEVESLNANTRGCF